MALRGSETSRWRVDQNHKAALQRQHTMSCMGMFPAARSSATAGARHFVMYEDARQGRRMPGRTITVAGLSGSAPRFRESIKSRAGQKLVREQRVSAAQRPEGGAVPLSARQPAQMGTRCFRSCDKRIVLRAAPRSTPSFRDSYHERRIARAGFGRLWGSATPSQLLMIASAAIMRASGLRPTRCSAATI
jgi:hypothetical protein